MVQKQTNNLEQEIILVLLKQENHLREIARMINQPHSTILRKLSTLQKNNIVDFKKQGKNKNFFLKKNLQTLTQITIAEKYKLTKLLNKYPKLSIILKEVLTKTKENLIILFGSYAKFNAKENSDVDIYIETTNIQLKEKLKEINSKINLKIGKFKPDDLLIKEIIKNHVILKGAEEFYDKIKFFE